jgi:hypothetical protein
MRLAFKEGVDREILALLLRTLTANSTLDWPSKDNLPSTAENDITIENEEKASFEIEKP